MVLPILDSSRRLGSASGIETRFLDFTRIFSRFPRNFPKPQNRIVTLAINLRDRFVDILGAQSDNWHADRISERRFANLHIR